MIRYSVVQPIESIGREAVQVFLAEHQGAEGIIKKIPAEIKTFSVE
jgi:DNA-binding LacI/PurR family transcriptional regulator